jgi:outer membrane protein TolC
MRSNREHIVRNPADCGAHGWRGVPLAWTLAAAAALLSPAGIAAQGTLDLTLDEAVSRALATHRSLDLARRQAEAADARLEAAKAALLPQASLSAGYAHLFTVPELAFAPPSDSGGGSPVEDAVFADLSVKQPLYTGGRLTGARDAAQARAFASGEDLSAARADLVLRVRLAYWDLARALDLQRVVEGDEALVRSHLADVERLLGEGLATAADRLKAEARLAEARYHGIASRRAVRSAALVLADLAGLAPGTELRPSTPLPPAGPPPPPAEELAAAALENRPDLRALRLREEAARAAVDIQRAARLPQVALSTRYIAVQTDQSVFPGGEEFNEVWELGLGASLDLWTGGAAAQRVREAEAEARRAGDALALASDAVALEVRQACLALEEARALVEAARTGVERSEEDLRVTRERFREGLVLNTEVLDSQVGLLEARLRLTAAMAGHAAALAALDRAVGR